MKLVDKAPDVFTAVIILGIVACIAFPLRVYVRLKKKVWGYDDWCMSIAIVSPLSPPGHLAYNTDRYCSFLSSVSQQSA